jgi:hypothetical protein
MDVKEIWWEGGNRINLTHDKGQQQAVMNMLMNLWVPQKLANLLSISATVPFS